MQQNNPDRHRDKTERMPLNKSGLFSSLARYIRIGKDTGRIVRTSDFDDLNVQQKIVAILCAQIAVEELDIDPENSRSLSSSDIAKQTSVDIERAYPAIRALWENGTISKDGQEYYLSNEDITGAAEILRIDC